MLIAGLTGNFGMGKSFVLTEFRRLGAVTIDSDRVVEMLLGEKEVIDAVGELIGKDVVDEKGRLRKKEVARRIFGDRRLKELLEAIIHPLVFRKIDEFINNIRDRRRVVIVEVPLLFEGDYRSRFQKVITVFAPEETAIRRLEQSGTTSEDAVARLRAQMPIEDKKAFADYTIDNSGAREETGRQVESVYRLLLEELERETA